jgi:sugar-specific transcriptional regulator TrmB
MKYMFKEIKNSLKELGFNNNEIKVYIALTQLGEATASQVARKSDLPRTTAISLLNRLKEEGYLTDHFSRGKTYYWVESPKVIGNVFGHKVEIAENLNKLLANLYRSQAHFPSVQRFDTKTGIKNFIENLLAGVQKKTVFYTIESPKAKNYAKIYFEEIGDIILREKRKKDIFTQSLIPYGSFGGIEDFKLKGQSIKIREMPEKIKFETSVWIIGNMLVHFSGNPVSLTAIKHDAICKSMKSLYDFLWDISTPKN